jgi:hypothetical protein
MPPPAYMIETRYSYLTGVWRRPASAVYVAESPESAFERHLQELFLEGQKRLHQEEYVLALQAFQEAMALILHTAHPTMPVDRNQIGWFEFPFTPALITAITEKTGKMLIKSDRASTSFLSRLSLPGPSSRPRFIKHWHRRPTPGCSSPRSTRH